MNLMGAHTGLAGATLLFWAWQTDHWVIGMSLAVILEGARLVTWRWEFSDRDLNRVVDLTLFAFIATTVYFANREDSVATFRIVLIWLPASIAPLLLAQRYANRPGIPLSALSLSLRWSKSVALKQLAAKRVDLSLSYAVLTLVSVSASPQYKPWFYPAVIAFALWGLWPYRSRRVRLITWLTALSLAAGLGYGIQVGLETGQRHAHALFLQWMKDRRQSWRSPYRSHTAIGDIGELKLSEQILFRVSPLTESTAAPEPLLLRDASYHTYSRGIWFADDADFKALPAQADSTTWTLNRHAKTSRTLRIATELNRRGQGLLTLPHGPALLERLPAVDLHRNQYGAVKLEGGPPLVDYLVHYDPAASFEAPPERVDIDIPEDYKGVISGVSHELGLLDKRPADAAQAIAAFFDDGYGYSLTQRAAPTGVTPIEHFLRTTRAGHCEYYATASVLLLRAAGIPARYATGYAAQEFSRLEGSFRVRKRHAHSWALAYIGGRWVDVDNTPSIWAEQEAASSPALQPIADLVSWLKHLFQRWRWGVEAEEEPNRQLAWLLIPLLLLLGWRLYRLKRVAPAAKTGPTQTRHIETSGQDSPFFAVLDHLDRRGHGPLSGEPLREWLARLAHSPETLPEQAILAELLDLHYRYRFDPRGLTPRERDTLQAGVEDWRRAGREA